MRHPGTIAAILALAACLLWRCSPSGIAGGNSSDTGNVVAIAASGTHIAVTVQRQTQVDIFDTVSAPFLNSGYHAWSIADSGDSVVFNVPASGHYNVLVTDSVEGTGVFAVGVPALADSVFEATYALRAVGGIAGRAKNSTRDSTLCWTFVYIPGSPFWDYTAGEADSGEFSLEGVPPGRYQMQFYGLTPTEIVTPAQQYASPRTLTGESDSVTVAPGRTTNWTR